MLLEGAGSPAAAAPSEPAGEQGDQVVGASTGDLFGSFGRAAAVEVLQLVDRRR
ncbi:hypothetical protein OHA25_61150 (plasmid) [Nonomuraea sp. NBC_00507]|uniref:hypothetical protein n=1 Tax=Nonomuraea sp. NBC_00507 TaxID=2976002 RepID=UPI002E179BE8